jgi:biotin synthase
MNQQIEQYAKKILDGQLLERDQIDELSRLSTDHIDDMLYWANEIRKAGFGNKVKMCSIIPGRMGGCSEDCAFCCIMTPPWTRHRRYSAMARSWTPQPRLKARVSPISALSIAAKK